MRPSSRIALSLLALSTAASGAILAQRAMPSPTSSAQAAGATSQIVAAANSLLATLDDAGRRKVQFPFEGPQKARWSNLPTGIFQREGLRLGDLNTAQRAAAMKLLAAALSANGYRKVTEIMQGDEVLRSQPQQGRGNRGGRGGNGAPPAAARPGGAGPSGPPPQDGARGRGRGGAGGGGGVAFGEDEYYMAFVGTPSTTTPWMLQFGGHHLAINLTMAGSQATLAPSLPGAQPARFTIEGREIRPLGKESDTAFALINALSESARGQAILKSRVADLVLGPGQDGRAIQPEGLRASAMSPVQQTMLLDIVQEWAGIMADGFAGPRMAEVKSTLADTYFAWSGDLTPGSPSYFRIQGPTLVIEFAPQGTPDHIHGIYRDPTNDYGAKIAKP